ncbi:transposable element Tcb2 transposase [Trichonephila clavipes]|nr:transposable element Tcb2 transposase [Trichonephila clavipes]
MWDQNSRIRVRRYAGEHSFPECVIERHSGLTFGVMVWDRSHSLPSRHLWSYLSARLHISKTVRDFCSAQRMQLLPWSPNSSDMSPIEHAWDLVGWCLARDPRPAASKDKTFAAYTSNMEFSSTSRHSKSV